MPAPAPVAKPPPAPVPMPKGPINVEFVKFHNQSGPMDIEGETWRVESERKTQGLYFRFDNRGDHSAGAFEYELDYFDAAGAKVGHDVSNVMGRTVVVAPGETKELRRTPNLIEIPKTAVRAELRLQEVCSIVEVTGGADMGECWWMAPGKKK